MAAANGRLAGGVAFQPVTNKVKIVYKKQRETYQQKRHLVLAFSNGLTGSKNTYFVIIREEETNRDGAKRAQVLEISGMLH